MRACVVTLTVLLVESPQLDLVGFVLGLLLQPAGPVGGRGGGRGGRGGRVFHHQSLEFINRQHTHTHTQLKSLSWISGAETSAGLLLFFAAPACPAVTFALLF